MYKILLSGFSLLFYLVGLSQYGAPPGQPGSTAIHKDSSIFIGWTTEIEVVRGLIDISNPSASDNGSNYASFGEPGNALGEASGISTDVLSLGDSGYATLQFAYPVTNGTGYDFAVFENGFADGFIELAFVEVSSDGVNFVRFPSISLTAEGTQVGGFGTIDLEKVYNLAGKYRTGYGTPFDLEELADSTAVNINAVTHIRIVDVIGSIELMYANYDSQGNKVNDPFPTAFASGGFDLDGVGVIHFQEETLDVIEQKVSSVLIYPNPARSVDKLYFKTNDSSFYSIELWSMDGKLVKKEIGQQNSITLNAIKPGVYQLLMYDVNGVFLQREKLQIVD